MAKMRQLQLQLAIPEQAVMKGFCYAFSSKLLEKLKRLWIEGKVFLDHRRAEENPKNPFSTYRLAFAVICHLDEQIKFHITIYQGEELCWNDLVSLIRTTEEFLAIFEKR